MNTKKAVYKRLFSEPKKTELKTHKVELGLIDDLNKALEESEETIKSLTADVKRINELNKLADKRDKESVKVNSDYEKAADKMFKLEDQYLAAKSKAEELNKRQKSLEDDVVEIRNMVISVNKKGAATTKKAQKQIAIFEKNISKANKMAQDLGVKLPIAKYQKAQDKLKSLI
jgi:chromosome segregation ATPase